MRLFRLVFFLLPVVVTAQAAKPAPLPPPTGSLKEEFSDIAGVRELSDGRVLISDRRDNRIVAADFATGRLTPVGRIGDGPGEFRRAVPIIELPNDSALMIGVPGTRWTVFYRDKIVATIPPSDTALRLIQFPYGVDRNGYVLSTQSGHGKPGGARGDLIYPDTSLIVRIKRSNGHVDTLGTLNSKAHDYGSIIAQPGDKEGRALFTIYDQTLMGLDGWVAIVRGDPYRVDWRSPDAKWTKGPLLTGEIKMDAKEQRAFRLRRGDAIPATAKITWPDVIPAVTIGWWPMMAEDGKVLIRRAPTADYPLMYDVVDHRGVRVQQIVPGKGQFIVGFGAKSVYVVTVDDDGIQKLSRHPW